MALRERPTQFLALTSLLPAEFDELLTHFAPRWELHHCYHTLDGDRRRIPAHQERANATLLGTDTKLFFLFNYLKTNLLQQKQAASFGVSQTRVSRLAGALLDVLNQTLAALGLLPGRDGRNWPSAWPRTPTRFSPKTAWSAASPAMPTGTGSGKNTALKKSPRPEEQHLVR